MCHPKDIQRESCVSHLGSRAKWSMEDSAPSRRAEMTCSDRGRSDTQHPVVHVYVACELSASWEADLAQLWICTKFWVLILQYSFANSPGKRSSHACTIDWSKYEDSERAATILATDKSILLAIVWFGRHRITVQGLEHDLSVMSSSWDGLAIRLGPQNHQQPVRQGFRVARSFLVEFNLGTKQPLRRQTQRRWIEKVE
jgi:hypothetical protein